MTDFNYQTLETSAGTGTWYRSRYFSVQTNSRVKVINRVYDSIAVSFVKWITSSPDSTGYYYPGPGTFGVNTSDYCITAKIEDY